jgi:hypothetical protein
MLSFTTSTWRNIWLRVRCFWSPNSVLPWITLWRLTHLRRNECSILSKWVFCKYVSLMIIIAYLNNYHFLD